jgi:glycosyltransferase involved in cell wall biosynthesis
MSELRLGGLPGDPSRVMFLYWGRRGMTQFAYEVARAALADQRIAASVSVSRQNESFAKFDEFGPAVFPIDTFSANIGTLTQAWRIPLLRRRLVARLREDRTQVVIELMPHVWSSFVTPAIRAAGVRYVTIIHDADAHPGDYRSGWVKRVLDDAVNKADLVLTLSEAVSGRLAATGRLSQQKHVTLFHPDLGYGAAKVPAPQPPEPGAALRLLWMGRIMPYKGLPLFLDAVDMLRAKGHAVEVGVFGEGALGNNADRLSAIGAEVVNRWLTEAEIAAVLPRFHAVVLSHTEASQSGIVGTALGAGLPTIATPVGGIVEQIKDRQTGMLAARADASALADVIIQLLRDPQLYRAICLNIAKTRETRSVARFVEDCVSQALSAEK